MKDTTIPADLIELKARFDAWRASRKYVREPILDDLWSAAADLSRRYPPSFVGRVLKLDPSRLKKLLIKRSSRTSVRKKPQATFFGLPTDFFAALRPPCFSSLSLLCRFCSIIFLSGASATLLQIFGAF